jgi:hypothetical protein
MRSLNRSILQNWRRLAGGAVALTLLFGVCGCIVESGRPYYHEHYHGWHEWR